MEKQSNRQFAIGPDKALNFKNFGTYRTAGVLRALKVLSNCANRANYAPTDAQIDTIEATLQAELDRTLSALRTDTRDTAKPFSL